MHLLPRKRLQALHKNVQRYSVIQAIIAKLQLQFLELRYIRLHIVRLLQGQEAITHFQLAV